MALGSGLELGKRNGCPMGGTVLGRVSTWVLFINTTVFGGPLHMPDTVLGGSGFPGTTSLPSWNV